MIHGRNLLAAAIVLGLTLNCAPLPAAAPDQPRMRAAIELLQSAKKSENPVPLLKSAQHQLKRARHNKGGERPQAAASIEEAIAQARAGDREKTTQKIDAAIAAVHSGMDKAK